MNFEEMIEKQKNVGGIVDNLEKPLEKDPDRFKDKRFFEYTLKDGKTKVLFRFLPSPDNNVPDIVALNEHAIYGKGAYKHACPLFVKGEGSGICPVCDDNKTNWDNLNNNERNMRKRKKTYYTNIYIIKNPNNPETEGKVFLYKFGMTIYKKIYSKLSPDEDAIEMGAKPLNIFDFFEGAPFRLDVRRGSDEHINYDNSEFVEPESLLDGDKDKLKKVFEEEYSLKEFFEAYNNLDDYNTLKKEFEKVVYNDNIENSIDESNVEIEDDNDEIEDDDVKEDKDTSEIEENNIEEKTILQEEDKKDKGDDFEEDWEDILDS